MQANPSIGSPEEGVVVVRGGAEVFAQEIAAERHRFGR